MKNTYLTPELLIKSSKFEFIMTEEEGNGDVDLGLSNEYQFPEQ